MKMKKEIKDIGSAMEIDRPMDKLIIVLSNKFCVAKPKFTNGEFGEPTLYGLNNGTVYSFGIIQHIESFVKRVVETTPNVTVGLNCAKPARVKHFKQTKWKQQYRRALKAAKQYLTMNSYENLNGHNN